MSWAALAKQEREDTAIAALRSASGGSEWVDAHTVASYATRALGGDPREGPTAQGIGRVLSRLAEELRCHKRFSGWDHRYRSLS